MGWENVWKTHGGVLSLLSLIYILCSWSTMVLFFKYSILLSKDCPFQLLLVVCDTFASLFVVVVVDVDVSNMFYTLYTGKSIHTVYNFILSVFSHITHLPL